MPSRRALLGAIGLAGVGIGGASQVRVGSVEGWTPPADTWPLGRYDPANTAANPRADPPTEPSVAWTETPFRTKFISPRLVVDSETVYAAGDEVAALARNDGTVQWQVDVPGGPLAVRDGTVLVAPAPGAPETDVSALRAFAADGDERWTRELSIGAFSLVVAGDTVFVGTANGVQSFDLADGRLRWVTDVDHAVVLVADGHLHSGGEWLARHRRRSLLDVARQAPPALAWRTGEIRHLVALAATDDGLLGGAFLVRRGPALVGIDPRDGEVRWSAYGDDRHPHVERIIRLATGPERCFVGLPVADRESPRPFAVASHRLTDGSQVWERSVEHTITDLVLAGDTVLVATMADGPGTEAAGTVRALRARDGSEAWGIAFDSGFSSLAPVDGTVFAATAGGRVFALR